MPTADIAGPLGAAEVADLLAELESASAIALAVSGGPDSLGMLAAVDRWRRKAARPTVTVLTVDHGLRPQSAGEAATVARLAAGLGLEARVLTWQGPHPTAGVEEAARAARYDLLVAAAREAGCSDLLLAHHLDDVAEGFLMRLERGAGVFGLAAMRPRVDAGGVTIVRPFLGVPGARLAATAEEAGYAAVHDPMNDDLRFRRARVRSLMPGLAKLGLTPAALAASAQRLADAADAIDGRVTALFAEAVTVSGLAVAEVDAGRLFAETDAVRYRAMTRLLAAAGGGEPQIRFEALEGLLAAMADSDGRRCLAGAIVERRGDVLRLYRESGRGGLAHQALRTGRFVWDRRFEVEVAEDFPHGRSVGALGEAGRRALGVRADGAPAAALATLPAIWRDGVAIALPKLPVVVDAAPSEPVAGIRVRQAVSSRLARPPLFPTIAEGIHHDAIGP